MLLREVFLVLGGSALVYAVSAGSPGTSPGDSAGTAAASGRPLTAFAAELPQGGSRLAATVLEGADGSQQFVGWHDTARDVDCWFGRAADGSWRCLPGGAETGVFFGDAACVQPLALVGRGCAAPRYAVRLEASGCGDAPATRVYSLGDRFAGPLVYWVAGGACVAVTASELAIHDAYAVGDEVPAAAFVSAVAQTEP